jgi:hypothetical protein
MAVGIWIYHGLILRADGQWARAVEAERLAELHVVVLESEDETLDSDLLDELRRELPSLHLQSLDASAAEAPAVLAQADLIIAPQSATVTADETARAMASSTAPKLLLPSPLEDWYWIGMGKARTRDTIRQTVHAIKQFAAGEEIKTKRRR